MAMAITWSLWDEPEERGRTWELERKRYVLETYGPRGTSPHYVRAEPVSHELSHDEPCDCHFYGEQCFDIELFHPPDCERVDPGDGLRACVVGLTVDEWGWDDVMDELRDKPGTFKVELHVEKSGGHFEPAEYDAYLVLEEAEPDLRGWVA